MILVLGAFDGFHQGHQALFAAARRLSEGRGEPWSYVAFAPHPALLLDRDFKLLLLAEERAQLSRWLDLPEGRALAFDRRLRDKPAREFLELLKRRFGATSFVVGHDFRFGRNREGDAALIRAWCEEGGGTCYVQPPVCFRGLRVSSTLCRSLVARGEVARAADLLGYPWFLRGYVGPGHGRGRRLGFPTANMTLPERKLAPAEGVYASAVLIKGRWRAGATSWGVNVTFGAGGTPVMETTVLDWEGDLYHQDLTVALLDYLRPMMVFPDAGALKKRIERDSGLAREIFARRELALARLVTPAANC